MNLPRAIFITLILFASLALLTWQQLPGDNFSQRLQRLANSNQGWPALLAPRLFRQIVAPPPLRGESKQPGGSLTQQGILAATNQQRDNNNVPALKLNAQLNLAAANKLADMFDQQYFDHVAPDGTGPADVIEQAGYNYLRAGENLALGNFSDDAELVQAWMDSPGHRANIVSQGYSEIGIAAASGIFEGEPTWLAVQSFGLPASVCPLPDESLKYAFTQQESAIEQLYTAVAATPTDLEQRAADLDNLVSEIKSLTEQGDAKIKAGNQAITTGNELFVEAGAREEAQVFWDDGYQLQNEGQALFEQADKKKENAKQQQVDLDHQVQLYNDQVTNLNRLNSEIKTLVEQLNDQTRAYNQCVSEFDV